MMKGISKGNRIAVVFVVLAFIFGVLGLCHSCSSKEKNLRLYGGTMTFKGHEYVVFFHPDFANIAVVHSEDCPCWKSLTEVGN